MSSFILCFVVSNVKKSVSFYLNALGFELINSRKSQVNEDLEHAEMRKEEISIMIVPEGYYGEWNKTPKSYNIISPATFYFYCNNLNEFYSNAIANNAISLMHPTVASWGDYVCRLMDPDGYVWAFAEHSL